MFQYSDIFFKIETFWDYQHNSKTIVVQTFLLV